MPPVPTNCRWLTILASWLVPRSQRDQWRRRWELHLGHWHEFLREHGQWDCEARTQLVRESWRSFPDAFWTHFDREQLPLQVRRFLGRPGFCLGAIGVLWLGIAVATSGLSSTRRAFAPLPYSNSDRLVLVSQLSHLNLRTGVRVATARIWQEQSQTLSGLAAWHLHPVRLTDPAGDFRAAYVTPNFFPVLGVSPALGRTFRPEDASASPPPVLLSHRLWREEFQAKDSIVGRRLLLDGRPVIIAGVLSPSFWAVSRRIDLWLPFQLDPRGGAPFSVSVVARLQPGVTSDQAQTELRTLARKNRASGSGAELASLEAHIRPRRALLTALLPLMALTVIAVLLIAGRLALAALGRGSLRYAWRYWCFFTAKASLLFAGIAAVWLELKCAAILNLGALIDPVLDAMLSWLFLLISVAALGLSVLDQRQRCPVCLSRLALPTTLGSWSSALFDPARTELLCEHGHGALYVPDTGSSASESERWHALDSSWRDLFPQPKR